MPGYRSISVYIQWEGTQLETNTDIWTVSQKVFRGLEGISQTAFETAARSAGFGPGKWRGWLLPAYLIQPEPISSATLRIRNPYTNATLFTRRLSQFAARGYLIESETGYSLSDSGLAAARSLIAASNSALNQMALPAESTLAQCNQLLEKIRQACLDSSEPHSKWCLLHNGSRESSEGHTLICSISQQLSDLAAWRDDCHLAAWQPYHYLHGSVWEVFTLFWRGEAKTIDDVTRICSEKRGIVQSEYHTAINELKMRGWLSVADDGVCTLTSAGYKTRQSAEDYTDEMFYAPFQTLSAAESQDLLYYLLQIEQYLPT